MLSDKEIAGILEDARRLRQPTCSVTALICDEIARLRAENARLKAARLRPEMVKTIRLSLSRDASLYDTVAMVFAERDGADVPYRDALVDLDRCYPPEGT